MISRLLLSGAVALCLVTNIAAQPCNDTASIAPIASISALSSIGLWITRTNSSYLLMQNDTSSGVIVQNEWAIEDINEKLRLGTSEHRQNRDRKALRRWMHYLNRHEHPGNWSSEHGMSVHHGKHREHRNRVDSHHKGGRHGGDMSNRKDVSDRKHHDHHKFKLNQFYLRHAQCRQCVANNMNILQSSSVPFISEYAPARIMKWCSLTTPRISTEQSPLITGLPLYDFEGYCIEATQSCPSDALDMNILDQSTCTNDEAAMKQSCALCVNDGYTWTASPWAVRHMDAYDGQCYDPASISLNFQDNQVSISDLSQCPEFIPAHDHHDDNDNGDDEDDVGAFESFFVLFVFLSFIVLCCAGCVHACKRSRAARFNTGMSQVALPVAYPVGSSVASAPPASEHYTQPSHNSSMYPAQMAAHSAHSENVEPLLAPLPQYYQPAYPVQQPQQYQPQQPVMQSSNHYPQQYYRL